MMSTRVYFRLLILVIVLLIPLVGAGQTTEFTYQGKLVDGALPANANYDFEFRLFAIDSGGGAMATQTRLGVPVANGIFTVTLDFGGQFDGSARWLEIAVKSTGSPNPLTVLTPRQPLTSTPHSIRSLSSARADVATNSLQLGGVNASQYVLTTDARMTDARSPLPNSSSYVQNTTAQQSSSNFNISGNGTLGGTLSANTVNVATQYNLGGSRILSNAGTANLFVGINTGSNNTTGQGNSFFGRFAGSDNTTANNNSFFGSGAGSANTTGGANSFFGSGAGQLNTSSSANSFFGNLAGGTNTTGEHNSFFGSNAGSRNTTGGSNSFFGGRSGFANTTGEHNSFFGDSAGDANMVGDDNAFFGYRAGTFSTANNNSFFGSDAGNQNQTGFNNSFFGREAGRSHRTGNGNSFFGNGAGTNNTTSSANSFFGNLSGSSNTSGGSNSFFGNTAGNTNTLGTNNTVIGANADVGASSLSFATAIGAGAVVNTNNTIALGRNDGSDTVRIYGGIVMGGDLAAMNRISVNVLGSAGSINLCWNTSVQIATCSSSLRYKTAVQPFVGGIDIVRRLRPISFNWKDGGRHDVGFAAEAVERVEPLLVTYNTKGEIEGVKYGQVTTVLVNAVSEQQTQIEQQHMQIEALKKQAEEQKQLYQTEQIQVAQQKALNQLQQAQIDSLKKLVCLTHPQAGVCKEQ